MNRLPADGVPIVLVVEDQGIERLAAVEMLQCAGFGTVDVGTGAEAVLALEEIENIQIMVTDIDLDRGINGIVLAACVDRRWPTVGIVMTSGKVQPVLGDVPSRALFLPKPYDEANMLAAVRGLMRDCGGR